MNSCYKQIVVTPQSESMKVLVACQKGIEWKWEEIEIKKDESKFCFIEIFDWDTSDRMNGQFVRTQLTESTTLLDRIGYDFLFNYDEIEIVKTNANKT
ncbi:MAG: hypothetical protein ACI81T_002951 [Bacteroidia bacterium]